MTMRPLALRPSIERRPWSLKDGNESGCRGQKQGPLYPFRLFLYRFRVVLYRFRDDMYPFRARLHPFFGSKNAVFRYIYP